MPLHQYTWSLSKAVLMAVGSKSECWVETLYLRSSVSDWWKKTSQNRNGHEQWHYGNWKSSRVSENSTLNRWQCNIFFVGDLIDNSTLTGLWTNPSLDPTFCNTVIGIQNLVYLIWNAGHLRKVPDGGNQKDLCSDNITVQKSHQTCRLGTPKSVTGSSGILKSGEVVLQRNTRIYMMRSGNT